MTRCMMGGWEWQHGHAMGRYGRGVRADWESGGKVTRNQSWALVSNLENWVWRLVVVWGSIVTIIYCLLIHVGPYIYYYRFCIGG